MDRRTLLKATAALATGSALSEALASDFTEDVQSENDNVNIYKTELVEFKVEILDANHNVLASRSFPYIPLNHFTFTECKEGTAVYFRMTYPDGQQKIEPLTASNYIIPKDSVGLKMNYTFYMH